MLGLLLGYLVCECTCARFLCKVVVQGSCGRPTGVQDLFVQGHSFIVKGIDALCKAVVKGRCERPLCKAVVQGRCKSWSIVQGRRVNNVIDPLCKAVVRAGQLCKAVE